MNRRPKVLVIGPSPPPYHGGSVATAYLLASQVGDRFELLHLDTSDRRGLSNIGRLDFGNMRAAVAHFAGFLRDVIGGRPDLIYVPIAQHRLAYLRDCLFLIPARALKIPVVAHIHGGGFGNFYDSTDPVTRRLVRWTLAGARRVIVLGEGLRGMLDGLVPPDRITVVPNGVGPSAVGGSRTSSQGGEPVRVLYLANLIESKGFLDVLRAARLLHQRGVRARWAFAGEFQNSSDRKQMEALIGDELKDDVELLGVVAGGAKDQLFTDSEIFVFPTYYPFEGHPYVILEAMAAGLPVITTAHAAIPETVVPNETGLFVPARDPHALAEALEHLIADARLRERMGAAGRVRYERHFTVERWTELMSDTFADALAA